jgi:hypothetical protein
MKNLIQKTAIMLIFLAITVEKIHTAERPRGTRKKVVAQESPAAKVSTQVDLLDQIVKQIDIIAKPGISTAEHSKAKTELNKLMKDRSLDARVKDVISKDISILTASKSRRVSEADHQKSMRDARDRLIAAINSIIKQANVVEVMEEGTTRVELATTPEAKDQIIKENIQNVQIAQAKADEASMMNRIIAGVKTTVAMPGDYIFGPERTKAKTAFEATVGAAVLGALAYLSYTYAPGAMEYAKGLYGRFMGAPVQEPNTEGIPSGQQDIGLTGVERQTFELSPEQQAKLEKLRSQTIAMSEAVYGGGEIPTDRSIGAIPKEFLTKEEFKRTAAELKLLADQGKKEAAELYEQLREARPEWLVEVGKRWGEAKASTRPEYERKRAEAFKRHQESIAGQAIIRSPYARPEEPEAGFGFRPEEEESTLSSTEQPTEGPTWTERVKAGATKAAGAASSAVTAGAQRMQEWRGISEPAQKAGSAQGEQSLSSLYEQKQNVETQLRAAQKSPFLKEMQKSASLRQQLTTINQQIAEKESKAE